MMDLPLFNTTLTEITKLSQEAPTELKAAQQEHPEFQEIYQLLQDQAPKNKKTRNFVLENSLLYRRRITTNGTCLQLCLPKNSYPRY